LLEILIEFNQKSPFKPNYKPKSKKGKKMTNEKETNDNKSNGNDTDSMPWISILLEDIAQERKQKLLESDLERGVYPEGWFL
jgi:hypothetical protein